MTAPKEIAETLISDKSVAVFSKSYCPYCKRAKEILKKYSLDQDTVGIIELDEDAQGGEIQNYLASKTGQRTVPNIFIKGQHVGGSSDLVDLDKAGKLKALLA